MREAKPWFRQFDSWWYVEVGGKQVKLAKGKDNRAEAVKQFHILMAGTRPAAPKSLTAAEVCDLFLRHSEREHEAATFAWHKHYLQSFCDRCGHLKATARPTKKVGNSSYQVKSAHTAAWSEAACDACVISS